MSNITLTLPKLHEPQRRIKAQATRFNVVDCGRRFGKDVLGNDVAITPALEGHPVGWFAPTYKMVTETWRSLSQALLPVLDKSNIQERRLELITGGFIDLWSLDAPNTARGRKYKRVVINEAAVISQLREAYQAVIRPTLTDYLGDAWFLSTPRGHDFFWECYVRGQDELQPDWASWQMPTTANPFIDPTEIEAARLELPERVYQQEYLAQFLEDSGGVFRGVREIVDAGRNQNEQPRPGTKYSGGVDLARVEDFTVISVLDQNLRQVYFERFNQISWERQIEAIKRVVALFKCPITLDCTGVGDPIYEALRKANVQVTPYQFTSNSKEALIDNEAMKIEAGDVRLMDIPTQTNELLAYQYELTPNRNVRMNAPAGMHDDTVIALGLALWGFNRKSSQLYTF